MDRAGKVLVTGSDDKTARVWSLPQGKLLKVLRPPIGAGSAGWVYAVAISPDGKTVAVGGSSSPIGDEEFDLPVRPGERADHPPVGRSGRCRS